ncbi:sugar transferase [Algibacter lectus]|uniref:Lipopolysaccharide/colanic/teichoic acid biosynthesis glycosyltransferase n=1 Tax=Algibacter lectus TaxID=221126 RepID=A0A4R8MF72_9FLAO|nr:sugar transferase [Algibacter lectus]MWW23661.1 sugar transferase [Algibacter lectus]TDY63658.1 lipopolysaccharide/colanic/teichoic acid biosynthesis glycosyltransferase [Algibacter lectus]
MLKYSILKSFFDFLIALIMIIMLFPIIIIVTIFLFIVNQGKPFFTQIRPGKNETLFKIIKFKTMNDKKDANGNLLPDYERLTSVGNFIRKTSMDEIPQLFNVLKGDMSFVGPRPLLPRYLPYYSTIEKMRHNVKPGITGYAQVNGRSLLDWDTKLKYDVFYVNNISLSLDIKILAKTAYKVVASKDISLDPTIVQAPLDEIRSQNE